MSAKKATGFKYFLWILPFMILVFLFSYFPLHGWIYSFYDYKPPRSLSDCDFVGLYWFKMLFSNKTQVAQLIQVMKNTFAMSLLGIMTSIFPLFFAVFLNEIKNKKFKTFVQTFTTLPNFISWVLVFSVAFALFSSNGMVNNFLMDNNFITEPIKFLDSDTHTYLKMLFWSMWKGLGWGSIIYLSSIASIDQELYEAASIDGAGRFQKMKYITIPELMPTFFVMLMMSVSNFLNNGMDQYYVFQNSFNKEHIQVLDLYVYNIGMTGSSYSLATAISMLKSIISVALLTVCNLVSKAVRGETIV
ncbi:MAG: ABC transporter permease subunit [Pseudobutyrivibrio sp.]|nr:ABC transporter permease subunit [Pseudobutyrivibrio sp.]